MRSVPLKLWLLPWEALAWRRICQLTCKLTRTCPLSPWSAQRANRAAGNNQRGVPLLLCRAGLKTERPLGGPHGFGWVVLRRVGLATRQSFWGQERRGRGPFLNVVPYLSLRRVLVPLVAVACFGGSHGLLGPFSSTSCRRVALTWRSRADGFGSPPPAGQRAKTPLARLGLGGPLANSAGSKCMPSASGGPTSRPLDELLCGIGRP